MWLKDVAIGALSSGVNVSLRWTTPAWNMTFHIIDIAFAQRHAVQLRACPTVASWMHAPQNATVVLLNASLLGCVGCLVFLLVGAVQSQSWLVPHLAFLLALAIGLWLSVNW